MYSDNLNTGESNYDSGDVGKSVQQLNSLLRGEISAEETYRMAVNKVSDNEDVDMSDVSLLREIQEEHSQAADTLRDRIQELGGEPSDSSGAWGAWAETVQGTMSLFGDKSALLALRSGEEHGLKDYQDAKDKLDPLSAQIVENQLISAPQRHINLIDQLIDAVSED